jgi:hypothetical protein
MILYDQIPEDEWDTEDEKTDGELLRGDPCYKFLRVPRDA